MAAGGTLGGVVAGAGASFVVGAAGAGPGIATGGGGAAGARGCMTSMAWLLNIIREQVVLGSRRLSSCCLVSFLRRRGQVQASALVPEPRLGASGR